MELSAYPSLEDSALYGGAMIPSPDHHHPDDNGSKWTFEENKLFEDALAEFSVSSPEFFENVAARVPRKTVDDIKKHYEALVEDVRMIESGQFPIPEYEDDDGGNGDRKIDEGGRRGRQLRKRGVPWTEEEHQLFLMGLNKYGKGDWRSISRYYVITKTPTQVASHAQKYYRRQNSATPAERRRPSIHDIQTVHPLPVPPAIVNTAIAPTPNNSVALTLDPQIIPNFAPLPAFDQNPNFYPCMPSSIPSAPFPPAVAASNYMNSQNVQADKYYM